MSRLSLLALLSCLLLVACGGVLGWALVQQQDDDVTRQVASAEL